MVRPSAYAVIRDAAGAVAVVSTPDGVFLPGGGIDEGETAAQAVVREAQEECGFVVRPGAEIARAVQLVEKDGRHFEKQSVFMHAVVEGSAPATELDHTLVWLSPSDAAARMAYQSHAWVLRALRDP